MEQATEKQVILLVKLGLEKEQAEKLSKYEASKKIKEIMINKRGGVKTTSSSTKKEKVVNTTTKEPKKDTKNIVNDDYDDFDDVVEKPKKSNYETHNDMIEMLLNQMRTDKDFLSKTKVGENKFDELAIFLYNYAKKNHKSGGFCLDTNSESYQKLEQEFLDKGFEKCMEDLCGKEPNKDTKTINKTTPKTKKTTTKNTSEKVESEVVIGTKVKTQPNKKVDSDDLYEQLCFDLGI